MIQTRSLRRVFGETVALAGLDLEVQRGEIFGLVGPDGAGKTTTMRLLTGILRPTSGSATVDGVDVAGSPERLKDRLGYMSQRFGLYPDLTVLENIDFYADIYGVSRADRREKIEQLLGFSQLTPFKQRQAGHLSGGMKQKLGLACALIHRPHVLFLDEPTNGVDPVSRRDFWRILYQLVRDGVTLFISTAYLDEAERCTRLALLHEGKLLAQGTPEEVKALMPGSLLEIATAHPRSAAKIVRKLFPSSKVGLFGDRLHLAVGREETPDAVASRLHGHGVEDASVRRILPSLEDVFVSVLDNKTADQQGGA
jgi:ABC-2 type transport system ATP-binding protein